MPVHEAVAELGDGRATQFDPQIVDALLACLQTGEAAPPAQTDTAQVDSTHTVSA